MPTVENIGQSAAAARTASQGAQTAASSGTASPRGTSLFDQFLDLIAGADAATATAAVTSTTASDTATATSTTASDPTASTTASDTDEKKSSNDDLAEMLAGLLQSGAIGFATGAGVSSPAELGGRPPSASQTSAATTGIDGTGSGRSVGVAGTGASLSIDAAETALTQAGTAAADTAAQAKTAAETDSAGADPLATRTARLATAAAAVATGDALTDAATDAATKSSLAAQTALKAATANEQPSKDVVTDATTDTTTDPSGLTSVKGRAAKAAGSDGVPLTYTAPRERAATAAGATAVDQRTTRSTSARAGEASLTTAPTTAAGTTARATANGDTGSTGGTGDSGSASADTALGGTPTTGAPTPEALRSTTTAAETTPRAEAARTTATTQIHAVHLAAVADAIATQSAKGRSRFDLSLEPAELGRIDVSLSVGSSGDVTARLVVDRAETLDMMLRDQRSLERSLSNAGLDVGSSGLQFSLRGEGDRRQDQARSDAVPITIPTSSEADVSTTTASDTAVLAYRSLRAGGVDLRV